MKCYIIIFLKGFLNGQESSLEQKYLSCKRCKTFNFDLLLFINSLATQLHNISFNPILYGLFLYVKIRGGLFNPPWLKLEKWLKLGKRHFLTKIDCCCPLFMHLELNYYHFWLQKGPKNKWIFTRIEGSRNHEISQNVWKINTTMLFRLVTKRFCKKHQKNLFWKVA